MTEGYKILYRGGQGELVEKKSRFIATTRPVESEEEALAFVAEMKKTYWDARHNCWAYVIGDKGQLQRCSDDGEPSQTAGRPMLDVLLGEGVRNACVVVTRYFGGVLLGTGGLVRAYSGAVQAGLQGSVIVEKQPAKKFSIATDYNGMGKIQYAAGQLGITILDTRNMLRLNPYIKSFPLIQSRWDPSLVAAWNQANYNPVIPVFMNRLDKYSRNHGRTDF